MMHLGTVRSYDAPKGVYMVNVFSRGIQPCYVLDQGVVTGWPEGTPVLVCEASGTFFIVGRRWTPTNGKPPIDNQVDDDAARLNRASAALASAVAGIPNYAQDTVAASGRPKDQGDVAQTNERVFGNTDGVVHQFDDGSWLLRAGYGCLMLFNASKRMIYRFAHHLLSVTPGITAELRSVSPVPGVLQAQAKLEVSPNILPQDPNKMTVLVGTDTTSQPLPGILARLGQFFNAQFQTAVGLLQLNFTRAPESGAAAVTGLSVELTPNGAVLRTPTVTVSVNDTTAIITTTGASFEIGPTGATMRALSSAVTIQGPDTRDTTGPRTETIAGNHDVTVTGNTNRTVSGTANEQVTGAVSRTIGGAETVQIAGAHNTAVAGAYSLTVVGAILIEGASITIGATASSISIGGRTVRTVKETPEPI